MAAVQSRYKEFIEVRGSSDPIASVEVNLCSQGVWPGLHLEGWEAVGGDLDETVPLMDALVVTLPHPLGGASTTEVHWLDERPNYQPQKPRTLSVYPKGRPYTVQSRGHWRGVVLAVDQGRMLNAAIALGYDRPINLVPRHNLDAPFIVSAVEALADDVRHGHPQGGMLGEAIASALWASLVVQNGAPTHPSPKPQEAGSALRAMVVEFVQDNLHRSDLSLAELATFAGTDVYSLSRWSRKTFGVPPYRYVLQQRVQRAQRMLKLTNTPLMGIALDCGFYSHSHFSTVFLRWMGISPHQFRKQSRQ